MTDRQAARQRAGEPHERDDRRGLAHAAKRRLTTPSWLARAAGVALSGVSVGFVVLFVSVLEVGGELALLTRPLPMRVALALPYLVGSLALVTTAGALLAWRYRYWSLRARIHQTVLALLGLAFSWQLSMLGFLPV
ncbi:hypothetical protein ACFQS5_18645 [Salinirubellus sp. GCM10025899]|uniref:hypothetical protein n=1 Tax=Salinirubellus sp. GCM10025899 TaxID=3252689 RepID=UPI003609903C